MTAANLREWDGGKNSDCPLASAIYSLNGKWKPMILHMLSEKDYFFTEIVKNIPGASKKVITSHLRELEADGLISRTTIEGTQIRVRYSLSNHGQELSPILDQLYTWALNAQR